MDPPTSAPCVVNVESVLSVCLTAPSTVALHALVRQSPPIASAASAASESSPAIPASTDSVMLSPAPDRPCEVTNSPHLLERFRASNRLQSGSPPQSLTWLSMWFRWGLCLITMLLVWISFPLPHAPSFAVNDVARNVSRTLNAYPNAMKFSPAVDSVQAEIFLGFTNDGNAIRIGVDSYCEGTLISSSVVKSDMIIHPSPIHMKGIGGSQGSPGYVLIPLRLQWGAQLDTIAAYVVDPGVIPQNVDVLFGLDVQRDLDISIDTPPHTVFVRSQSIP